MTMICVSSICCFVRFQYDLIYASSEKPWFPRHVPFQIHDTRKQWQWSVFRQSVVLSGFNMTWNTPHLRNLDFQDMSLFRSMTLENNDNDLCFVNLLFCQVSIWLDIQSATTRMLLPTARKCIPLVRNTDNDLPLSRSFKSAAALRNTDNFENRIWF